MRVRYWWTEDGEEGRCDAERVPTPVGEACDHCGVAFTEGDTDVIRLTPEEGGAPHDARALRPGGRGRPRHAGDQVPRPCLAATVTSGWELLRS